MLIACGTSYHSAVATRQLLEELTELPVMQELAKELYQHKSLLIMGRGFNFATCLEGALVRIWI